LAFAGLAAQAPDFSRLFGVTTESRTAFAKVLPTFDLSAIAGISTSHAALFAGLDVSASTTLAAQLKSLAGLAGLASALDASKWLPIYDFDQAWHASTRIAQQFEAISKSSVFAAVADSLERVRPVIEGYEDALADAPDAAIRRLTFVESVESVLEVAGGLNFDAVTPKDIFKHRIAILWLLVTMWFAYLSFQSDSDKAREIREMRGAQREQGSEIRELRREQREQALAMTALTEAMRQLQADEESLVLRVVDRSILRAGPDGGTPRVTSMKVGRMLKVLAQYRRWYYVEILTEGRIGTEIRGWVYRRNVEKAGR
jgi:hypothetical protein